MKAARDRKVIRRAAVLPAQLLETEDAYALEALGHMQRASAAQIKRAAGHMGSVFGFEVGETEERLAHLRCRTVTNRRVPCLEVADPVEPVIGRAVQRQDVHLALDQFDERQEQRAVEPVLVEIARRAVAGGDDHRARLHQRGEEAAHDGRIGSVVYHHFVEGEAAHFLGQARGDSNQRVFQLRLARLGDAAVDFEHEGVEVNPALGRNGERLDEQVHQHRLAAPDAAPDVEAARGRGLLAEQLAQQPAHRHLGLKRGLERG